MEARALAGARALCGCRILDELRGDPGEPGEAESRARLAATLQARWGCPRAGHEPPGALPVDLLEAAQTHAEVTGLVPLRLPDEDPAPLPTSHRTCPFAAGLSPWGSEIARVMRLGERMQGTVSAAEILGRTPHVWDVRAMDAVVLARGDASASNDAIRERERRLNVNR